MNAIKTTPCRLKSLILKIYLLLTAAGYACRQFFRCVFLKDFNVWWNYGHLTYLLISTYKNSMKIIETTFHISAFASAFFIYLWKSVDEKNAQVTDQRVKWRRGHKLTELITDDWWGRNVLERRPQTGKCSVGPPPTRRTPDVGHYLLLIVIKYNAGEAWTYLAMDVLQLTGAAAV